MSSSQRAFSQENTPPAASPVTGAAPAPATPTVTAGVVPAVAASTVALAMQPPAGPGPMGVEPLPLGANMHAVNLNADGAITGRVSLIDARTGQRVPTMDVITNFVQFGRIVAQARPGQNGEFTVRLRP